MENVFEWAKQIDKEKRHNPNRQLQEQLFRSILATLAEENPSFTDCVNALMKFDRLVVEPFYRDIYLHFTPEKQRLWDRALVRWAEGIKPTENATMRIVAIVRIKLERMVDIEEILPELDWLSLHEDKRSAKEYYALKDASTVSNLRKLLNLDMTSWNSGQAQIGKLFSILFSDSMDEKTKELYTAFLARHGLKSAEPEAEKQPIEPPAAIDGPKPEDMREPLQPAESRMDVPLSEEKPVEKPEEKPARKPAGLPVEKPVEKAVGMPTEQKKEAPRDGVSLAEALLTWARDQNQRDLAQVIRIAEMATALQRAAKQLDGLSARVADLETSLAEAKKIRAELEKKLECANESIDLLEAEKTVAQDTIGRVQQMSGNSVKQELDGFKHALALELSKTAKDFASDASDFSDAEKAEVYKALIDEILDTLRHNGVVTEEN